MVLNQLSEALESWDHSIQQVIVPRPKTKEIDQLARVIIRLRALKKQLNELSPLRPYVSQLRLWRKIAADLNAISDSTLEALTSPDIAHIQETLKTNQQRLDRLTEQLGTATLYQQAAELLERGDNWENGFDNLLAALQLRYPSKGLVELDEIGALAASQVTKAHIAPGQGIQYLSLTVLADVHLDPENFRRTIKGTTQLFGQNAHRLSLLMTNGQAVADLARAKENILDVHLNLEAVLGRPLTDEQALRQLMKLYHTLYEEGGLPIFAWLLLVSGQKTAAYSSLLLKGATTLGDSIVKHEELSKLFSGVNKDLRTAASHGLSYILTEEGIAFRNLKTANGILPLADFADTLFAFIESLLAVMWALDNQLELSGATDHRQDAFVMGLNPTKLAQVALSPLGVEILDTEISENTWILDVGTTPQPLTILACSVALNALPGVENILVRRYLQNAQPREVLVPALAATERITRHGQGSAEDKYLDVLRFLNEIRIDGKSALTMSHLKFVAGRIGLGLDGDRSIGRISDLRWLLSLSASKVDQEFEPIIRKLMRVMRIPAEQLNPKLKTILGLWADLPPVQYDLV
ncbi:hypothetical protein [Paeniglutamicibacter psychrophenolicus]|uniref:Uncharacterized protein n=1 Tax=Paeniglutamicibacter psychrophenolicus TaxID=257454 RepID=A0ABS4WJS8_9MICC|nr:hypothetical protein [Paeniglutamicibacter psychrophenolicus]MBP2376441.1 hypothetical protein [Paeniglutamicibacter psychrophenolicus]